MIPLIQITPNGVDRVATLRFPRAALVRDEKKIVLLGAQSLKPTIQARPTVNSPPARHLFSRLLSDFYVRGGPYGFVALEV